MRAHLPEWTVFVGLTAMLEPGVEMDTVIQSMGFKDSVVPSLMPEVCNEWIFDFGLGFM